jgi:preprotein translocase subunit SecF
MRRRDRVRKKKTKKKPQEQIQQPVVVKKVEKKQSIYYQQYKKLLIIPFALLIIAILIIALNVARTGDFINKDVSLKGGFEIIIPGDNINVNNIENFIGNNFAGNDFHVRSLEEFGNQIGVKIEIDVQSQEQINSLLRGLEEQTGIESSEYSVGNISPVLGEAFFRQTMIAVLIAFVFMGIVVFFYFRSFVPSATVILAAFSDILMTIAITDLLGITLGTAGIAALLMLIGYSVDTNILLNIRVLKRQEGTVYHRVINAMKTGLTMNLTTMAAVIIALVLSQSDVLSQIMTIILIGLIVDLINTWIQNAGILRYYLEKKGIK